MLTAEQISELSQRYQTSRVNILREYLQHLFLSYFYQQKGSENFLFKGGTALRIIYNSPRFSEDLDFSGLRDGVIYEKIIERVLDLVSKTGDIKVDLTESKKTSGGWIGIFLFHILGNKIRVVNEISYRDKEKEGSFVLVSSSFIPPYRVFALEPRILVEEKINALVTRKKPRDIFDLYFILRDTRLRKFYSPKKKELILNFIRDAKGSDIERDLGDFLPLSYKPLLKELVDKILDEL